MANGTYYLKDDLLLRLSEDGRELLVEFKATEENRQRPPIQLAWLLEKLTEHGLDKLHLNKDAISQCIQQYNDGKKPSAICICECIDGEFSIRQSDDHMRAYIKHIPAQGGEPVTKTQILAELARMQIIFGIDEQAIDNALSNCKAHDVLIAQGQPVVDGKDGYFEKLIEDIRDRRPRIDDQGRAFYK